MAINLMTKYATKLAERYALQSKTDNHAGKDFEFTGVKTLEVLTATTYAPGQYTRSGTARFGEIKEIEDTKQTFTMTQDISNALSIDAGNAAEQYNVKAANKMLKAQWDEQYAPFIDKYRLQAWATGNGLSEGNTVQTSAAAALTKANIAEAIFNASAALSDANVPATGRVMFISELDFVKFKLADMVIGGSQLNAEAVKQGFRGTIDGVSVVTVPSSYMPAGVGFIMKHKNATVDPMKHKVLRLHKNPMGVDGDVLELRVIFDSFVLDAKCKGVYVHKTA